MAFSFKFFFSRPAVILSAIGLLTAVSAACLPFFRFDGRIEIMLPERSGLGDIFLFLREVRVADKVMVTFSKETGAPDPDALVEAADGYLAGLDPRLAVPVRVDMGEVVRDLGRLSRQLPDYVTDEDLETFGNQSSPESVRTILATLKDRMYRPEGVVAASLSRSDPLGWSGRMLGKIMGGLSSFGYRVSPYRNHLMDPDRRSLLLILQTSVPMTDTAGVRELLLHLERNARGLPPGIRKVIVCGHIHTARNEDVIRRDITITGIAVSVVFLVLFLGVYRDWRTILIVLIPFLASIPALALAASVFGQFSYIVMGFGSVIAGIAIDYGIHTYVASKSDDPARNLRLIRLPVTLSALTTLCVFIAFCFSDIPAYRQLGVFASLTIIFSLLYAFLALPLCIPGRVQGHARPLEKTAHLAFWATRFRGRWILAVAGGVLLAGFILLARLRMDADLSKMDGTPPDVLEQEKQTLAFWGGGEASAAILSVEAPELESALILNDRLYEGMVSAGVKPADLSSLSPISPSLEMRKARRRKWAAFWTPDRARALRETVERESAALGFSENAFAPFWEMIEGTPGEPQDGMGEEAGFLKPLIDRFVHEGKDVIRITSFVPDKPVFLDAARSLQNRIPSLRVISRNAFSADLSKVISLEVGWITVIAAFFVVGITGLLIRRLGMILMALTPAVAGMVWGGAGMALLGLPLNIANLISGIIVFGLTVDYGICMVFAHRDGMTRDVFEGVTLSALTTILGAATLLLARHPAFFSIGVTLVSGVSVGYLYAWLVLPAMHSIWGRKTPASSVEGRDV